MSEELSAIMLSSSPHPPLFLSSLLHRRRAAGLAEILGVLIVILLIVALVVPRFMRSSKAAEVRQDSHAVSAARDAVCQSNLAQLRQTLSMYMLSHSARPAELGELGLPADQTHCAVGGEEYTYSKDDGQVHCPHAGHEAF